MESRRDASPPSLPFPVPLLVGLGLIALAIALGACGDEDRERGTKRAEGAGKTRDDGGGAMQGGSSPVPRVERIRCPADLDNCESARGRIIYVERVDPDGDGDAHFVLGGGGITFGGVSVIDVREDLRPHPLPRAGDMLSAAGPVYEGSYGQRQIEAIEVAVAYAD